MKIVACGTLKGGTGKTSVAYNLGGILEEQGYKVLFGDVDPQSNLSDNAGVDTTDQDSKTIRDVFENPAGTLPQDVIVKAPMPELPNLDIIPSHIRLTATERRLVSAPAREHILERWLKRHEEFFSQYDFFLIDTNPSMGDVNQNAFMAADSIILVSDISRKAVVGAELFTYLWGEVLEAMQLESNVKALIINNFDKRTKKSSELREFYAEHEEFGSLLLKNVIPARVDVKDTETKFLPINHTAPKSDACKAFRAVVNELKERGVF